VAAAVVVVEGVRWKVDVGSTVEVGTRIAALLAGTLSMRDSKSRMMVYDSNMGGFAFGIKKESCGCVHATSDGEWREAKGFIS
jgi:hypothetical protein